MAAGLQCWDAQGNICVDLADYYLRYVGSGTITMPSVGYSTTQSWPGISPDTHIAFITSVPLWGPGPDHIIVVENGIRLFTWMYGTDGNTYGFDVFRYK